MDLQSDQDATQADGFYEASRLPTLGTSSARYDLKLVPYHHPGGPIARPGSPWFAPLPGDLSGSMLGVTRHRKREVAMAGFVQIVEFKTDRPDGGNTVQTKGRRLGLLIGLVMALLLVNPMAGNAATRLSGDAYYDAVQCPAPPPGYADFTTYPGLVMTGSLEGCLYTKVTTSKETPSGVYLESGEEVFVGSLDGGPVGTFATTYKFESKWDPDVSSGVELHGRCQHPIVEGSGTGGLEGATGRLDFKDIIGDPVTYVYRGHISLR